MNFKAKVLSEAEIERIHGHSLRLLSEVGVQSRQELEQLMDAKGFLELWVKVRSGWADDEAHLRRYGYE